MSVPTKTASIKKDFKLFYADAISKSFGGLKAVDSFSAEIGHNEIVGLIGPNGAGKTTIFNLISGFERPDSGRIHFMRSFIEGRPPHKIAALGIARTFQTPRLLNFLSVVENVKIAFHTHLGYNLVEAVLRLPRFINEERESDDRAMELLELFGLANAASQPAGALPYGSRRKLEMARALATEASLILLDEPAAGLNPSESEELTNLIRKIRSEFQVSIFLIEHDMKLVMGLCDKIVAINFGRVIAQGSPSEVKSNPEVIEAYLGAEREIKEDGGK